MGGTTAPQPGRAPTASTARLHWAVPRSEGRPAAAAAGADGGRAGGDGGAMGRRRRRSARRATWSRGIASAAEGARAPPAITGRRRAYVCALRQRRWRAGRGAATVGSVPTPRAMC
eukprot:930721-Prymnesium_polylepis.1